MNNLAYHQCMDKAYFYVQVAEDLEENGDMRNAWKELCCRYKNFLENDLIALTTKFNTCRMKSASNDCTLWYAELEHIHQYMQKTGMKEKFDAEMIMQIMTQIPKEYTVATQAIYIMPAANRMLKIIQQVYILDL